MNNNQFRRLVLDNATANTAKASSESKDGRTSSTSSQRPSASATPLLGSRARSSIPMTPRSVAGYKSSNEFARQMAEHRRELTGEPPTKKFKSSAAPKGSKLAQGYQDRALLRKAEEVADTKSTQSKEERLKALEELLKLQQIDLATFEKLRDEIGVGGDVGSTHLVKGLDWKLLERVKRGEDVLAGPKPGDTSGDKPGSQGVDVDDELESVLAKEVQPIKREEKEKRGVMAPPSLPVVSGEGERMSRDEIIQRLKASRLQRGVVQAEAAPPPDEPSLGDRFKKVGSGAPPGKKKFIEVVNGRRREVLVITEKDGRTKRKTRWLPDEENAAAGGTDKPEATKQQPLGMAVPAEMAAKQKALLEQLLLEEDEDGDIFDGVGADYDPLHDIGDDSEEASDEDHDDEAEGGAAKSDGLEISTGKPRNYFSAMEPTKEASDTANPLAKDPVILAALSRAAALRQSEKPAGRDTDGGAAEAAEAVTMETTLDAEDAEDAERRKKLLDRLQKRSWDDDRDIDFGFGESRFGDEEDEDDLGGGGGKKGGRKRGPKKRKGDKDNVNDVMSVLSGRGKGAGKGQE